MKKSIITSLALTPFLLAAQITLKRYDDPNMQGYKSIIFEQEVGKNADGTKRMVKKEYDIKANNPYENINATQKGIASNGLKKFELNSNQASQIFQNGKAVFNTNKFIAASDVWVEANDSYASVSYNLFAFADGAEVGLRKSTLKVVNIHGDEIYSKEIDTDSHGVKVTPNGRYLGYGYGESTHDVTPEEFGYKIIDILSGNEIVDIPVRELFIAYIKYDYLIFRGYKESKFHTWIFNYNTLSLHELEGKYYTHSSNSFIQDGTSKIITNLTPYRIR